MDGDLPSKLDGLRKLADERPPHPKLWRRSKRFPKVSRAQRRDWCARAWWGIAAGELVRFHLYDRTLRDKAMGLLLEPDWSELDRANENEGVILASAHLGPPKFAMNALLDRFADPFILTNMEDMPSWLPELGGSLWDPQDAEVRAKIMLNSTIHLRKGGIVFAAVDGGFSGEKVEVHGPGRKWEFSLGLPALARMTKAKCFACLALWQENRIVIRLVPIEMSDVDHSSDAFHQDWIEKFWDVILPIIEATPENLRFFAGSFRKEFNT